MAAITTSEYISDSDAQSGILMESHHRFGHLCYDTIVKMAHDSASGIILTDTKREKCLACTKGKKTERKQSKADSGKTRRSTLSVLGFIRSCDSTRSAWQSLVGQLYSSQVELLPFVSIKDKRCCSVDFLASFKRKLKCRIHVFHADEGGEYKTSDVFCQNTGVVRQVSEAKTRPAMAKLNECIAL